MDIATPAPWICPRAGDGGTHPLRLVATGDRDLAWRSFARARGLDDGWCDALTAELFAAAAEVDAPRHRTRAHLTRADALSAELGFAPGGGVWLADETVNLGGSHKLRHLWGVLCHLRVMEHSGLATWTSRPPLAIASCGNAAVAAAVLAMSCGWTLQVFVPRWVDEVFATRITGLGGRLTRCPPLPDDPPGDPCLHRFREAVEAGAIPFAVNGLECAPALDTGRTLGWELADSWWDSHPGTAPDRVFVQVGGGALATCVADGLHEVGCDPGAFHAVQTTACAPLARAWDRLTELVSRPDAHDAAVNAERCMEPWTFTGDEPQSAADGILDDETYDWVGIVEAMARTGGSPVVVDEAAVTLAHELVTSHTTIAASPTGTAGLAGLVAMRDRIGDHERVVAIATGAAR